jgi:hypothetical protein
MMMKAELIANLPMADYLAIEAASSGGLKVMATRSPKAFRDRAKDSTPAQTLGTLAHLAIWEPDSFADVVVMPDCDRRTNAGKHAIVDWLTEIVGEPFTKPPPKAATGTILDMYLGELLPRLEASPAVTASRADYDLACAMRDALMDRSDTRAVLEADGLTEVTGLSKDQDFEVPCKVRPDKLLGGEAIIVSLKTCQSVGERDYLRTAWTYGYPGAAWFYRRILETITGEPHRYWEIAVESAPPHDALLVEYTEREIDEAAGTMRRGLELYRRCIDSGIWPGSGWDWDQMDYTIRAIGRTE